METQQTNISEERVIDMLRSMIVSSALREMLTYIPEAKGLNMNIVNQTSQQLVRFEHEIRRVSGRLANLDNVYYTKRLNPERLKSVADVIDILTRIGVEENKESYDSIIELVLDGLWKIFYTQKHRRKPYIPKYKALLALIFNELKRDANGEPTQVIIHKTGELFLRTHVPEVPPQVK